MDHPSATQDWPHPRLARGAVTGRVRLAGLALLLVACTPGPPDPDARPQAVQAAPPAAGVRPADVPPAPPPAAVLAPMPTAPAAAAALSAQDTPPDPAARGPYTVGATRRTFTRASNTTGEPRPLDTVIWYPAMPAAAALPRVERLGAPLDATPELAGRPYPVVMFSQGASGMPGGSTFFTTHLVSHGFIVISPAHPGTTTGPCPFLPVCTPLNPDAREWVAEADANRPDDIRFALHAALELSVGGDVMLAGMLDPQRLGMTGASAGGKTTFDVIPMERRFRAAVPLIPAGRRADLEAAVSRITVPTLVVGAERDHLVPFAWQEALWAAFPANDPERWFVVLRRGGHGMLIDWCPDGDASCGPDGMPVEEPHPRIQRWATAFLRRYVAGDPRYAPLLDPSRAAGDPEVWVTHVRAP